MQIEPLTKKIWKIRKKSQKSKDFFEDLKSGKNPKKSQISEKFRKKFEKSEKIQVFFWGFKIGTPYLGVNNPSANFSFELDPDAILKSNFGFQSNCFETM